MSDFDVERDLLWLDRLPLGWSASGVPAADVGPLARLFLCAAHREATASQAYRCLYRDLAFHGTPRALLAAVEQAGVEEGWQSLLTAEVAASLHTPATSPVVFEHHARSLEELALANEIEGCVHETFGAVVSYHQACHAREPRIAELMRGVAKQERGHALLAWQIARWLRPRLGPRPRRRILDARIATVEALIEKLSTMRLDHALISRAGLPSIDAALDLAHRLQVRLWHVAPPKLEPLGFVGNAICGTLRTAPVRATQSTLELECEQPLASA